jgi:hypothetical protein
MRRSFIVLLAAWASAGPAFAQTPPPASSRTQAPPPAAQIAPPAAGQSAIPPASSHAASNVGLQTHPLIEARNALEHAFIDASDNPNLRAAFRRSFLESRVALALSSNAPDAPPASIQVGPNLRAGLIFTSTARMTEVMGEQAPRAVTSGRQALERLRGGNVVININLRPYLVLDAEGVNGFLDLPDDAPPAPAPVPALHSSGPTQ